MTKMWTLAKKRNQRRKRVRFQRLQCTINAVQHAKLKQCKLTERQCDNTGTHHSLSKRCSPVSTLKSAKMMNGMMIASTAVSQSAPNCFAPQTRGLTGEAIHRECLALIIVSSLAMMDLLQISVQRRGPCAVGVVRAVPQ